MEAVPPELHCNPWDKEMDLTHIVLSEQITEHPAAESLVPDSVMKWQSLDTKCALPCFPQSTILFHGS